MAARIDSEAQCRTLPSKFYVTLPQNLAPNELIGCYATQIAPVIAFRKLGTVDEDGIFGGCNAVFLHTFMGKICQITKTNDKLFVVFSDSEGHSFTMELKDVFFKKVWRKVIVASNASFEAAVMPSILGQ
jgi:hypothetical protein